MTGICDLRAIAGSASASSWLGQATRTMSQPAAVSSAICCSVALTSAVSVVVIDCTLIGASTPTPHLADLDLAGLAAGREDGRRQGGQSEVDGHAHQYRRDLTLTLAPGPPRSAEATGFTMSA